MNHHFAASWLQKLSEKLEQLTEWSWAKNRQDACSVHRSLFKEFFSPQFQKTLALVDEQKKEGFLKVIERNLYKFDDATQQFPLGCLCALLLHGKDARQPKEKVVAWVEFLLQRLRGSPGPEVVTQVVEECLSAPFQKFVPLIEEKLKERLADGFGAPLPKMDEALQKRVLKGFPLVMTRIEFLVTSCTAELNRWLVSAPRFPSTPMTLADTLAKLEHPLVKFFTAMQAPAKKEAFLVAVALALQGLRTRFKWMVLVEAQLESMCAELQRRLFTVDGQGQVMEMWLQSRLNKYNSEVTTRLATILLDPSKPEQLRQRLQPLFPARRDAGDPEAGWVGLARPSSVSDALLAWIAECVPGSFCPQHTLHPQTLLTALQRLGRTFEVDMRMYRARVAQAAPTQALPPPPVSTGQPAETGGALVPLAASPTPTAAAVAASALAHLRPGAQQLQQSADRAPVLAPKAPVLPSTEHVDNLTDLLLNEALEGVTPELRCTVQKLGKGVYKLGTSGKEVTLHTMNGKLFVYRINEVVRHMPIQQLLTEEGLASTPSHSAVETATVPALTAAAAPAAAVDNSAVARIALQSKAISTGVTTTTVVGLAQPGVPFTSRPESAQKSDPQALMSKRVEAATYAMDVSKQIVRRSINFEDEKFLRKLLKRGLKEDKQWQAAWKEYCVSRGAQDADPKSHDKEFVATFIERNLFNSMTEDWAKRIIDNKDKKKEKKEKDSKKKEKKRKASDASTSDDAGDAVPGAGGAQAPRQMPPTQMPPPQMDMPHQMGMAMFGGPPGMPMGMGAMGGMFTPGMGGMPMWAPVPGMDVVDDERVRKKVKGDKEKSKKEKGSKSKR